MKRIELINISGRAFKVEEDAFQKLISYSNDMHSHFRGKDGEEIIIDIETRLSELFMEILRRDGKDVLNINDIDAVINRVGKVSDFDFEEKETETAQKTYEADYVSSENSRVGEDPKTGTGFNFKKRLFRDPENKMIAGICSGLSPYLGIDVTILRILWLASCVGVIPYIIMWFLVPKAKSKEDFATFNNPKVWGKNKFYRDVDNKIFGGVCAGMADVINVDPIWVRIVVVIIALPFSIFSSIAPFPIIPLVFWYFVLWFMLPKSSEIENYKKRGL